VGGFWLVSKSSWFAFGVNR